MRSWEIKREVGGGSEIAKHVDEQKRRKTKIDKHRDKSIEGRGEEEREHETREMNQLC